MLSSTSAPAMLRRALFLAAFLAAALAVLTGAPRASAAPVTYDVGAGASVTLSNDEFAPGDTIQVSGTGFVGTGGSGFPQVCIKLNDESSPLGFGGADATTEFEPGLPTFQTAPDGSWSGEIHLPASLGPVGPEGGANAGKHWLRILSGVPTSGTNVTAPITFKAYFTVRAPLAFGFTNTAAAGSTFFPGTTITPTQPSAAGQGTYTAKGRAGFPANTAVTATFDGNPVTLNPAVTTDAGGEFTTSVVLPGTPPSPMTAGNHTLTFSAGSASHSTTLKVVAHTAALLNPQVRSGERAYVKVSGFLGIDGQPQKIALVGAGDAVLSCTTPDATGSGMLSATINGADGPAILRVASGTNCVPPLVTGPVPRFFPQVGSGVTISATAPQAGTAFTRGSAGTAIPVSGSGFGAGEAVQARLDDVDLGTPFTATGEGAFAGTLTLPAATPLGHHVLTFVSTTRSAADHLQVIVPPSAAVTSSGPVAAGETVSFTLSGFVRGVARDDGATGQKVGVRIDTGAIVACVQTDDAGAGTGSVTLPADLAPGEHTLRFLAGSSCVQGQANDLPSRSIPVTFQVSARAVPATPAPTPPPTPTPTPAITPAVTGQRPTKVSRVGTTRLRLGLAAGAPTKVRIAVSTKGKIRLTAEGKRKIVRLVKATTVRPTAGKARTITLKLTADGRALLRRTGSVKVVVTVDPTGAGTTTSRTFTLRR